jgi:hypothetical protein
MASKRVQKPSFNAVGTLSAFGFGFGTQGGLQIRVALGVYMKIILENSEE